MKGFIFNLENHVGAKEQRRYPDFEGLREFIKNSHMPTSKYCICTIKTGGRSAQKPFIFKEQPFGLLSKWEEDNYYLKSNYNLVISYTLIKGKTDAHRLLQKEINKYNKEL